MLSALAVSLALAASGHAAPPPLPAARCGQEDAPSWVWSRCGNRKRGIATLDGAWHRVVGPCAFRRLYPYIDWSRTDRLRGDWTARHACRYLYPVAPESIY